MDYAEAYKLKQEGKTYVEVGKILNVNPKTVETGISRYALRLKAGLIDNKTEIKEPISLLKLLEKEQDINTLIDKTKKSKRVLEAEMQDLTEEGFQVVCTDNKYKLLKAIVPQDNKYIENWNGETVIKFGVVSDTHLCNKWQQLTFLNTLYDIFQEEEIETVYHAGDLSDGYYRTRPSHIYELIPGLAGVDAQAQYIIDKYPQRENIVTKFITGNHDDTHIMNGGANIGKMIAKDRKDMIYLGMNNAKVNLTPKCILEVNHPIDGAAYALSYTLQKLIDSMMGGEKPNILINGHHHKAMYLFYRNIHAFEAGTIEAQTPFMHGKKLAAMMGGYIIEVHVDKEGTIQRCTNSFIPMYKALENDY
jgi:predicted phosphodiesterase